jgi:hypothetical protein
VLLVDGAEDVMGDRAAFCIIPVPQLREARAGTRRGAVWTEVRWAAPWWMMQAVVMACRVLPGCMSRIGGRPAGVKKFDAFRHRDGSTMVARQSALLPD